jgi:predicted enzyme related to lactoylglutathione lyase
MRITGITPQLRTQDLDSTIRFYTEQIGLILDFRYSDFYAGIRAGDQLFHLKLADHADPSIAYVRSGEHFHLYLACTDVDALASKIQSKGVRLHQEPRNTEWGTRELVFHDDQGHTIYVGQQRAEPPAG